MDVLLIMSSVDILCNSGSASDSDDQCLSDVQLIDRNICLGLLFMDDTEGILC